MTRCEFGSDVKTKLFRVPWTVCGNRAAAWYCGARPVRQGSFWALCRKHWKDVGHTAKEWRSAATDGFKDCNNGL